MSILAWRIRLAWWRHRVAHYQWALTTAAEPIEVLRPHCDDHTWRLRKRLDQAIARVTELEITGPA